MPTPDQTNQTPPTQPVQGQGSVQPPAQGQPQGGGQPFVLTPDEFEARLKDAEERAFRRSQQLYEQGRTRFEAKVQNELSNLKTTLELQRQAGIQITPEQELALRQRVIDQAFDPSNQGQPPTQPAQANQEPAPIEDDDPVVLSAINMSNRYGFQIEDNDPEMSQVYQGDDGYEFLKSWEQALQSKATRLGKAIPGQQPPVQPPHVPTNAGGMGAATNQNFNTIRDLDELEKKIFT